LNTRLAQARDFFKEGNHVKITVKFTGRQMGHTEFGFALLKKIKEELSELAEVEREEKLEGRNLTMILTPRKGQKKKEDAKGKD
jgi:translation initiation factor IF-3